MPYSTQTKDTTSPEASHAMFIGAIKHEIERNAKTLKIKADTVWVDTLNLEQSKGVWDAMSRASDAAVIDATRNINDKYNLMIPTR